MKDAGCDFCSKNIPAVKEYKCRDFMIAALISGNDKPTQLQNSIGNWWACDACSKLVDINDREALAKRAIELIAGELPRLKEYELLRKSVRTMHDGFFANRY